jgi:hypothetical protein
VVERQTVIGQIAEMARELEFEQRRAEDPSHVSLFRTGSPFVVHVDLHSTDTAEIYIFVRTTSWDFPGDRTDLHESLSVLLAYYLRTRSPFISSTILDVRNGFCRATEVGGRFLVFEQPFSSMCQLNEDMLTRLRELLSALYVLELLSNRFVGWDAMADPSAAIDIAEPWARDVAQAIGEPLDDAVQFVARTNPSWLHYRSIRTGITVWQSRPMAETLKVLADDVPDKWETMPGIGSDWTGI